MFINAGIPKLTKPVAEMSVSELRSAFRQACAIADVSTCQLKVMRDILIPGPSGAIRIRLFDAIQSREPGPAVVFFHGGGFVMGEPDIYNPMCSEIARALDLPLIAVDYRLAPEHPWPSAHDDCEAAARWVAANPSTLGRNITGLVLIGESTGGSLAIATAMALRDSPAAVPVILQALLGPAVDLKVDCPPPHHHAEALTLTGEGLAWMIEQYNPDLAHWRSAPMQGELGGLPPAVIAAAQYDPLRDAARNYASELIAVGNPNVTYLEARGHIHGCYLMRRLVPSGHDELIEFLHAIRASLISGRRRLPPSV